MINWIVLGAIALSIAFGYKTKFNTGFFAIVFSYLIGCFMLDLKTSALIDMWPMKIFFVIFGVALFYNFATLNGTLEKMSQHMLYATRKAPRLLPLGIFFAATIISGLGAGFFAVMAFFGPITMILCRKTGLSPLVGALAANYGALCGNNFMTSAGGVVFIGLMENAGYGAQAYMYDFWIFLVSMIIPVIVLSTMILFSKSKAANVELDIPVPEKFDSNQKKTIVLILLMVATVLLFPILHQILPQNEWITFMNKKIDIGLVSVVFTLIALCMGLGKEKDIIAKVPWGTLIMICGVGMLIAVAIKAGTVKMLASWVGASIPPMLVPIALALIGGFMSFFSSTMGVVTPALFPIVPSIAEATGLPADALFLAITIGAQATAISPFSSGGSLLLSAVGDDEKDKMFSNLMFKGAPLCMGAAIVFAILATLVL